MPCCEPLCASAGLPYVGGRLLNQPRLFLLVVLCIPLRLAVSSSVPASGSRSSGTSMVHCGGVKWWGCRVVEWQSGGGMGAAVLAEAQFSNFCSKLKLKNGTCLMARMAASFVIRGRTNPAISSNLERRSVIVVTLPMAITLAVRVVARVSTRAISPKYPSPWMSPIVFSSAEPGGEVGRDGAG